MIVLEEVVFIASTIVLVYRSIIETSIVTYLWIYLAAFFWLMISDILLHPLKASRLIWKWVKRKSGRGE